MDPELTSCPYLSMILPRTSHRIWNQTRSRFPHPHMSYEQVSTRIHHRHPHVHFVVEDLLDTHRHHH
jgi:hypothetical protein